MTVSHWSYLGGKETGAEGTTTIKVLSVSKKFRVLTARLLAAGVTVTSHWLMLFAGALWELSRDAQVGLFACAHTGPSAWCICDVTAAPPTCRVLAIPFQPVLEQRVTLVLQRVGVLDADLMDLLLSEIQFPR